MARKINIAIIGCGYWGPNLVRNFSQLKQVRVSCVCDRNKERLTWIKSIYPKIKITNNTDKIINDSAIEVVALATPPLTHYCLAKASFAFGEHTYS